MTLAFTSYTILHIACLHMLYIPSMFEFFVCFQRCIFVNVCNMLHCIFLQLSSETLESLLDSSDPASVATEMAEAIADMCVVIT